MNATSSPEGTKEQALHNARLLLAPDSRSAERQARIIIEGDPECVDAHTLLGMALRRQGRADEALEAEQKAVALSMLQPTAFEALMTLSLQQLDKSEQAARTFLGAHPENAAGMRLLAEVAARMGQFDEAERLLRGALAVAPHYDKARSLEARIDRARVAVSKGEALPNRSIGEWVEPPSGESPTDEALQVYEIMSRKHPEIPEIWVSFGHLLRTIGEQDKAVDCYRRAIDAKPTFGEAWYAIGDLKASRYSSEDVTELQQLAHASEVSDTDRSQLFFALGRALEQFGNYSESFRAYAEGNRLRSKQTSYDAEATTRHVDRSIQVFDADYFAQRASAGEPSKDPIFILGLPRAGSTLLEQILASHSLIEATGELTDITNIANSLSGSPAPGRRPFDPEIVARLPEADLQRLGRGYLWNAGLRRRTSKPLFIDKMPNNWMHLGFILSILPNAKIIDARRHPLACCFSNFRQYFVAGQEFTYSLSDIGRFYRDYVTMMSHFDKVLPGRVYRVVHERLVSTPDEEVRRLLDFVGVDFEETCLRFYENKRAVRTASSEQVRRPINREGLDQWRNFEPWLEELRQELGPIVDAYPEVPSDLRSD